MADARSRRADVIATVLVWSVALLVTGVFLWLLADIVRNGFGRLSWAFLTSPSRDAGREGGIGPMLVSTGLILAVCLAVSVPIGLGAAALLAEFTPVHSRFGRFVRRS